MSCLIQGKPDKDFDIKHLMASYEDIKEESYRRYQRIVKIWIICLGSFSLSMVGGLILAWWQFYYHPTNEQQWMVPIGLILFFTPLIVWFSVFLSDICNSSPNSLDSSPEKPFHDPER
ncbi:uncharacterized protein LOC111313976 [Olea europaea subsp. europaea]|uniref:Uncharacterized protein LOC111313976 n=1 Tax=Olea europaea subsp. europaea TaxID=158383 RepID=A0A8S0URY0_OLEEU|nr:uncharacterized protein LOC111313976 [Olea europaea subsp. europaea]